MVQGKRATGVKPLKASRLVQAIAKFAADAKAYDIIIFDMRKVANFCDYFILSSGTSSRQVQGITDEIEEGLSKHNIEVRFKHGYQEGRWVLLDMGDVVVHIFEKDARVFYGLDHLWQEAKKVEICAD
jgi:ribosome-associated protein